MEVRALQREVRVRRVTQARELGEVRSIQVGTQPLAEGAAEQRFQQPGVRVL